MLAGASIGFLAAISVVNAGPSVQPMKHQQMSSPGSGSVICDFETPLAKCRVRTSEHLHQAFDATLDLSPLTGNFSLSRKVKARYAGEGLELGHCGVELMMDRVFVTVFIECCGVDLRGRESREFALLDAFASRVLPSNSTTPHVVSAAISSNVFVLMSAEQALDTCFVWSPDAGEIDLSPGKSLPSDTRYRRLGEDRSRCGAHLPKVTHSDAGVWRWRGFQEKSNMKAAYSAVVLVEAAPVGDPDLRVRDSARLLAGDWLNATCRAPPAVPPANLAWTLDGEVVRHDEWNDTLPGDLAKWSPWLPRPVIQTYARRLTKADSGKTLTCIMSHPTLTVERRSSHELLVLGVSAEKDVIRTAVGRSTELACLVHARLNASVHWTRNGHPVQEYPGFVDTGNNADRHWLRLEDTAKEDLTNFTCTASSLTGAVSQSIHVTGVPGTPERVGNATQDQLTWRVESVAPLEAYRLRIRQDTPKGQYVTFSAFNTSEMVPESAFNTSANDSDWWLVQISDPLLAVGQYKAYLQVFNQYGQSAHSPIVNVTLTRVPPAAKCQALATKSMDAVCTLAGLKVDCANASVPAGTTAVLTCREGCIPVDNSTALTANCTALGWRPRETACRFDCGRRTGGFQELSRGGTEALPSEFPWHVAVFKRGKSRHYEMQCGGSLISPEFFVSAAHCFWNMSAKKQQKVTLYKAAVGKHTLLWANRDTHEQRRDLKDIYIPDRYTDFSKRLEADIAVVRLSTSVDITPSVNVVCIDWETTFEERQFVDRVGTVPGWGATANESMSPTLRYVDLPFVPYLECHQSVPTGFQDYLIADKICGGFHSRSIGVCLGDSGGGYVFPETTDVGRRYFLRGVVSTSPRPMGEARCQPEHRSLFTLVSEYAAWIRSNVFDSADGNR